MKLHNLLASTALTTGLLVAAAMPAAATTLDFNGYAGPVTLQFFNYEGFLTPGGTIDGTANVGDQNFGIFKVSSISNNNGDPIWTSGNNGNNNDYLVGVFDGINVKTVTAGGATTNTGGTFQLYLVPNTLNISQGLAGYANETSGTCTIGGLCYHGVTDVGGELLLSLDLTSLTASIDPSSDPTTGSAQGNGTINGGSDQAQFLPNVHIKDSFCPNANVGTCEGADGSTFPIASSDPISATAVPEPASLALLGGALLGFGSLARRRRSKQS